MVGIANISVYCCSTTINHIIFINFYAQNVNQNLGSHSRFNLYSNRVGIEILAHNLYKKRVLFEQKKKTLKKWHFVENKTDKMQYIFKDSKNFLVS